jgi:SAM-dependent methyltransferase
VNNSSKIELEATGCPLCRSVDHTFERSLDGHNIVKCKRCGFVYANPRPTEASLQYIYVERDVAESIELYKRIATANTLATYDSRLLKMESMLHGKGKLLDFGCAAGYFTERAQVRGWEAYGIDLGNWVEPAAAERGLKNVRSVNLSESGFAYESFDVINVAQVFEHLLSPRDMLKELLLYLRPGGLFYIDVPNYNTLPIMLGVDDFDLNRPLQHINFFSPATLEKLLRSESLSVLEIAANSGLKWENLVGRRVISEIADAYSTDEPARLNTVDSNRSEAFVLKQSGKIRRAADFIMYDTLKLGMCLYAFCRKPI